ncbi:precorrin-3B synthase [Cryptosporangium phraense]|uniref:Precorrin-3B synthase n=1 Tax=Cryptosporangium phraense TaxID=2593070 RepID=A0A545AWI4_9ACTN|nr:precorrin-3B synthase [Cryptosporangium phraense]TQS45641.1 precorrin-3B synthase [Cryptosporangium phraense]
MPTAPSAPRRAAADRCPGALQVHPAADGGLARVRVPGGVLSLTQWDALRAFGPIELTSRANVQIRGVSDTGPLAERLASVGLLPSETHERVRNIVASPLGGAQAVVTALDQALCAAPDLAALSGRFLFAVDVDRDVAGLGADVTVLLGADRLLLAGVDSGLRVAADQAVAASIAAARCFLAEREAQASAAWRLSDLDDGSARVARRLSDVLGLPHQADVRGAGDSVGPPVLLGVLGSAIGVGAPLGRLTVAQMQVIGRVARDEIIVTPWRGVVLPGIPAADAPAIVTTLDAAGLVTDPTSAWATATACTGLPGCAKSRADVRGDASRALSLLADGGSAVHFAGCERRCGRPAGAHVDVLATDDGYRVDGGDVRVEELAATVAAARRGSE